MKMLVLVYEYINVPLTWQNTGVMKIVIDAVLLDSICNWSILLHISLSPFHFWQAVITSLYRTETLCEQHNERMDETFSVTKWPNAICSIVQKKHCILFKTTVVNQISCSFLSLLAADGEDMQSPMSLMFIHFPRFNKTSPTDETQNRRQQVFISETKVEAIIRVKKYFTSTQTHKIQNV